MIKKLILGTTQFGLDYGVNNEIGKISSNEIIKILDFAYEKNLITLDTASVYGNSENLIGEYLQKNQKKKFNLTSKISSDAESLTKQFLNSLQNMKTKKVHSVLFHSIELYNHFQNEINPFVNKFKGNGFEELGVSLYSNKDILSIVDDKDIDRVQVPFNLLDNASKRKSLFLKLKSKSKKIDTRSTFLQGLFFKPLSEIPVYFKPIKNQLLCLQNLSKDFQISMESIALSYVLQKDYVDSVLIGVDSLDQLKKNLSFINEVIPIELVNKIDSINVEREDIINPSLWPKFL